MMQETTSSNKIKENKYKILRMSLLLGNGEDREDTINNFEDAAREIDAMNDEIYLKDLEGKFYETLTLEEEEKKLAVLVDYIGGRIEQRLSLLSDFSNVTGYELNNLGQIKYSDKLDEYKERLTYIRQYLENKENIDTLGEEISDLENKLNDSYLNKAKAEKKNEKDEEILLNKFSNIIKKIPTLADVNLENVEDKLNDIVVLVNDSKKSLEIFDKSYDTLSQAGISNEEKKEYLSYVTGAKEVYYSNKEQEYLLRLFLLFNSNESDYNKILFKRDSINNIIRERISLREELNVNDLDVLDGIYDLLEKQYNDIKAQKDNIDMIDNLSRDINDKKARVEELEKDNQRVEILSLLKEFCVIDTYEDVLDTNNDNYTSQIDDSIESEEDDVDDVIVDSSYNNDISIDNLNDIEVNEKDDLIDEVVDTELSSSSDIFDNNNKILDVENVKDNQVVSVVDASKINFDEATKKSNAVMQRVGEMLGIKIEKSEIVNVSNDNLEDNSNKEDNTEVDDDNNIFMNTNFNADPETNSDNISDNSVNPLFNNSLGNSTLDDVMGNVDSIDDSNDSFWYSNEDSPIDLNSLPDLPSTDNNIFFGNDDNLNKSNSNNIPSLDFPSLDFNFESKEEN